MSKNLLLPEKSFCGIGFGHSRWFRHLGGCPICLEKWDNLKRVEKERLASEWNEKCGCGCGRLAALGKRFYRGHFVLTECERGRRSEMLLDNNPMKKSSAKEKISRFWMGRSRPEQVGDRNVAKRSDVRQKISDHNPMRNAWSREKQKDGCLTEKEVNRRSLQMRDHNPSKDKSVLARRIDTYTKRLANGEYHIRNNWKTGWYDRVDGGREWYDSSYELDQMKQYDAKGVIWTKKHGIRIPYVSLEGIPTYYVPDFLVSCDGRLSLVEVKGWMSTKVKTKALIAIEYCRVHRMNYILLMGKDRIVCEEFSFIGDLKCKVV